MDEGLVAEHVPPHVELAFGFDNRWYVDDLLHNRRFTLDPISMALLVAVAVGTGTATEIADRLAISEENVFARIARLRDCGLVRPDDDDSDGWAAKLRDEWRERGWEAAARYHLATFDYPFLDYSAPEGGFAMDRRQMGEYRQIEPDTNRVKRYPDAPTYDLPAPAAELLPEPLSDRPAEPPPDALARVLSMSFGSIGEIAYDVQPAAPALRRTSPSGGARHPSEAYLVNLGFTEFPPGIYHMLPTAPCLERIGELPEESTMPSRFQATWARAPFPIRGIVLITCVFERNMYRYREPRTFRTVHMDAGHLAATVELTARALGLQAFAQYRDSESGVEDLLNVHFLEEGYLLSVALG